VSHPSGCLTLFYVSHPTGHLGDYPGCGFGPCTPTSLLALSCTSHSEATVSPVACDEQPPWPLALSFGCGDGRAVALAYSLELGRRFGPCVQRYAGMVVRSPWLIALSSAVGLAHACRETWRGLRLATATRPPCDTGRRERLTMAVEPSLPLLRSLPPRPEGLVGGCCTVGGSDTSGKGERRNPLLVSTDTLR
jgi:hypothetical protein